MLVSDFFLLQIFKLGYQQKIQLIISSKMTYFDNYIKLTKEY